MRSKADPGTENQVLNVRRAQPALRDSPQKARAKCPCHPDDLCHLSLRAAERPGTSSLPLGMLKSAPVKASPMGS